MLVRPVFRTDSAIRGQGSSRGRPRDEREGERANPTGRRRLCREEVHRSRALWRRVEFVGRDFPIPKAIARRLHGKRVALR